MIESTHNILMTGATGFLGSHVARLFLQRGCSITAISRTHSNKSRFSEDEIRSIHWIPIEADWLEKAFQKKYNAVIHLATNYGYKGTTLNEILEVNLLLPLQILDAAAKAAVPLFISTDTLLTKFLNDYALTKSHLTDWGRRFAERGFITFCNLRIEHIYGAGDNPERFTDMVIRGCRDHIPYLNLTLGEQYRDFVHVSDVAEAYRIVFERLERTPMRFHEFEVGTGVATRVKDFVEQVHRLTKSRTELRFGAVPYRLHEIMYACANIAPLRALGWEPRIPLAEGLKRVLQESSNPITKN
jgi:CDP-paratose synthetase